MLTDNEVTTLRGKLNGTISILSDEGQIEGLRYALKLLDLIENNGDTYLPDFFRIKIEVCDDCEQNDWELYDTKGEETPSGDYDVPPQYKTTEYIYRCRCCGKIIKTYKEYDYA